MRKFAYAALVFVGLALAKACIDQATRPLWEAIFPAQHGCASSPRPEVHPKFEPRPPTFNDTR